MSSQLTHERAILDRVPPQADQRIAYGAEASQFGDLRLPKVIHLKVTRRTPLYNGALECRLFEFPIVAGRAADAKI